jgi:hypothetical protein
MNFYLQITSKLTVKFFLVHHAHWLSGFIACPNKFHLGPTFYVNQPNILAKIYGPIHFCQM